MLKSSYNLSPRSVKILINYINDLKWQLSIHLLVANSLLVTGVLLVFDDYLYNHFVCFHILFQFSR